MTLLPFFLDQTFSDFSERKLISASRGLKQVNQQISLCH